MGVSYLETLRTALSLPVRTWGSSVLCYHLFRLDNPDLEYNLTEVCCASLLLACKVEDTLKKGRDIVCAAKNFERRSESGSKEKEWLSPDDPVLEIAARNVMGIERLMLEAGRFNFRSRAVHVNLIKILKSLNYAEASDVVTYSWAVINDAYRTFIPLKQTSWTMDIAAVELAIRFLFSGDAKRDALGRINDLRRGLKITSQAKFETILDLLDLYASHHMHTHLSKCVPLDKVVNTRIALNSYLKEEYPEFLRYEGQSIDDEDSPGGRENKRDHGHRSRKRGRSMGASPITPISPNLYKTPNTPGMMRDGEKGRGERTVRYVMSSEKAEDEKRIISEHYELI